jgi:4-hydroxythreonine-4-phosphate dehydrogenase
MKPILGITMGDPSGNGPEISIKALMDPSTYEKCRPLIVGDAASMEAALKTVKGAEKISLNIVKDVKDAKFEYGTIDVYDMGIIDISKRLYKKDKKKLAETMSPEELEAAYKESQTMCGECAFQYVKKVIEMAMAGEVDATVTNALNKDHINMAGHHYSGHTEIYAHYTNTPKYTMMLAHGASEWSMYRLMYPFARRATVSRRTACLTASISQMRAARHLASRTRRSVSQA